MSEKKFMPSIFEVLNALASVVTISGISIIWLGDNTDFNKYRFFELIIVALGVSAFLGFASIIFWYFLDFYRGRVAGLSVAVRFSYFALGIPVVLLFFVVVLLLVNKVLILINWSWFFHG